MDCSIKIEPTTNALNNQKEKQKEKNKNKATEQGTESASNSNIVFEKCYTFEATCPFKECAEYNKVIFKSQQAYQQHHGLKHETRDKFRNNLVWKCPQCGKQCSSFYNFSAHVSMHRELCQPPWICTLPPVKHSKNYNNQLMTACNKRSSTKNNLISHIRSVHKLNVIGYKQERNSIRKMHPIPAMANISYQTNQKRTRENSNIVCGNQPQSKRLRTNGNAPPLHPLLLHMYNINNMGGVGPMQHGNGGNSNNGKEAANVFPGFNHCQNTNLNNNNPYDNIIVPIAASITIPTPPSVHNSTAINRRNEPLNTQIGAVTTNNMPPLPNMQQLRNLCTLLQSFNNQQNNNNNNKKKKNGDFDAIAVMNCINYIKNCEGNQSQNQHDRNINNTNGFNCNTNTNTNTNQKNGNNNMNQMVTYHQNTQQQYMPNMQNNMPRNHNHNNNINMRNMPNVHMTNYNNIVNNTTLNIQNMINTLNNMNSYKMNNNINNMSHGQQHTNNQNMSNQNRNSSRVKQSFHSNLPSLNRPY